MKFPQLAALLVKSPAIIEMGERIAASEARRRELEEKLRQVSLDLDLTPPQEIERVRVLRELEKLEPATKELRKKLAVLEAEQLAAVEAEFSKIRAQVAAEVERAAAGFAKSLGDEWALRSLLEHQPNTAVQRLATRISSRFADLIGRLEIKIME
ncbi:MAG: hypothetical protein HY717_09195 [Planctomycetes bacterium]|nr:hypothetical protein [Planctomycetota bacterium]